MLQKIIPVKSQNCKEKDRFFLKSSNNKVYKDNISAIDLSNMECSQELK